MKHLLIAPLLCTNLYITDGNTIRCDGEQIRIMELDTPETFRAKCEAERVAGFKAKERLSQLLKGQPFTIERAPDLDKYERTLARIMVQGRDVAEIMIMEGDARPYHGGQRRPSRHRKDDAFSE